jgi:micrococcal nuclease
MGLSYVKRVLLAAAIVGVTVTPARAAGADGRVLSWTDGDTLRVALTPGTVRVRLIGIGAPETSRGDRAAGQGRQLGKDSATIVRLGRQAKAAAQRLAPPGTRVRIETDVQPYDRYGRLLAYVYLPDARMVNEELVRQGWAMVLTIPPNVRYVDRFVRAQQDARQQRRGLWSGIDLQWIAASPPHTIRLPVDWLAGSVISGATAAVGLLSAYTTWHAAWFVPWIWRLQQAVGSLLLGTIPLLGAVALNSRRQGAPLLLVLLAVAVLLTRRQPVVGLLAVFVVATGPWASLWPVPDMHKELEDFIRGAAADPTNPSFLLFVGMTLVALGRVALARWRWHSFP